MLKKIFSRSTKYQNFWKWFTDYDSVLFHAFSENHQHKAMFQLLSMRLKNIHRDIGFELGFHPNSNKIELVISPCGSIEAFEQVKLLMSKSIVSENWLFTAFKQRKNGDFQEISFGDFSLNYSDIFIEQIHHPEKFGIRLKIRGFKHDEYFIGATYSLLDSLIGEFDVTHIIDFIDWDILDESEIPKLLPFIKLRSLVDLRKIDNNT